MVLEIKAKEEKRLVQESVIFGLTVKSHFIVNTRAIFVPFMDLSLIQCLVQNRKKEKRKQSGENKGVNS